MHEDEAKAKQDLLKQIRAGGGLREAGKENSAILRRWAKDGDLAPSRNRTRLRAR